MDKIFRSAGVTIAIALALLLPSRAAAHCDTMGGPVIADAKIALEKGDLTPVLKWVRAQDEGEIRVVFNRALKVRAHGPEARELADRHFFETLVRIHRAGEGFAFTGLQPAEATEPIVDATDKALEAGRPDKLAALLQEDLAEGIRERFTRALEAKKHAGESVAAGRYYVQAYVELTHYMEALQTAVRGKSLNDGAPASAHVH